MSHLVFLLLMILGGTATAAEIPTATDLATTGSQAGAKEKPVLVFFYQERCHYCEAVRKQFLRPIMNNDRYTRRITVRQVNIRRGVALTDFQGRKTTHSRFAAREGRSFTPTVAFYGPHGDHLAEPLIGLKGGLDYYGHYLDKAIEHAARALSTKR